GYVSKRSADRDLINAIRTVMEGGTFLDSEIVKKMTDEDEQGIQLSDREVQVLCMYVKGFTLKEIAYQLGISEKTVDTYKNRIFEKTGISSRPELLNFAVKRGFVKIDS
ncbi:MAG: LuxR C-terminal-related transcriptional regulator, partial [Myxococcota bacterium]